MPDPELERGSERILDVIGRQIGAEGARWLENALEQARTRFDRPRFLAAYAGATRRLRERVPAESGGPPECTALAERARAALLNAALDALPEAAHVELVHELYRRGDSHERVAVLRSLPALPAPARFLSTAIDACRNSVQIVFEAIACENPYPASHFPDAAFQQLALKALFTGVALARIEGLAARCTPELARMASDYASELRAAGRAVSGDVERLARGVR